MLLYLKYLIQLLLAPSDGWQDVADSDPSPAELTRRGFLPLLGVVAVSELCGLLYNKGLGFDVQIIRGVIDFGACFVALYVAGIVFDVFLGGVSATSDSAVVRRKGQILAVMALGEMALIRLVCNLLQAEITILRFLPLYVVLILYKAAPYAGVRADSVMRFTAVAALATVVTPELIHYLLTVILL